MSRGNLLSDNESALRPDGLCSNLEFVTSQNIYALCLSVLAYEMRMETVPTLQLLKE